MAEKVDLMGSQLNRSMANAMLWYWAKQMFVMDPEFRNGLLELRQKAEKNELNWDAFVKQFKELVQESMERQSARFSQKN